MFICTLCTNKTKRNTTEHAQIRETSTTQRFYLKKKRKKKVYFSIFFRGREINSTLDQLSKSSKHQQEPPVSTVLIKLLGGNKIFAYLLTKIPLNF